MAWTWVVWELLVNAVELAMFLYFLYNRLGCTKRRWMWAFAVFDFALTTALNFMSVPSQITMPVIYVVMVSAALLIFNGSYARRFFWGSSIILVVVFVNYLTVQIAATLPAITVEETFTRSSSRIVMTILYLMLEATVFILLMRIRVKEIELPRVLVIVMLALMLMTVVSVALLTHLVRLMQGNPTEQIIAMVTAGAMFLLLLGLAVTFDRAGSYLRQNIRMSTELEVSRLERAHTQDMVSTMQAMREWRHDFHNHMELLKYYADNELRDEMTQYIGEMTERFSELSSFISTGNTTVDAILSSKQMIAQNQEIPLKAMCAIPAKGLPFRDVELCVILGNLMDNAIEASARVEPNDRYIELTMNREEGMFRITAENASAGGYEYDEKGELKTSKKEAGHGIGLNHIRRMIVDAGGFLTVDANEKSFAVDIMIPIEETGGA